MKKIFPLLLVLLFCKQLTANVTNPPEKKRFDFETLQRGRSFDPFVFIGLKIGAPNVLSFGGEFILPFADNRLAPFIDYGSFKYDRNNIAIGLKFLEYGLNIYVNSNKKGFYGSISKASLNSDVTYSEIVLDNNLTGKGSTDLKIDTYNFKAGYKTGNRFYFRFEIGYGVGEIPENLVFLATASNGMELETTQPIPKIPGVGSKGMVIGNIGFGIAF